MRDTPNPSSDNTNGGPSDQHSIAHQQQLSMLSSINSSKRLWKDVIDTVDFLVDSVVLDEKREARRRIGGKGPSDRRDPMLPGCSRWDNDSDGGPDDEQNDKWTVISKTNDNGLKCPICLSTPMNDPSYTDTCTHQFCFVCIKEWCKVRSLCPLCKQRFKVVYHNLDEKTGSKDEWKIPLQESNLDRRFSYRDTLTGERLMLFEHISRLQSEIQSSFQNQTLSIYQNSLDPIHRQTRHRASELTRYVQLFRVRRIFQSVIISNIKTLLAESATMPRHAFLSSPNFRRFIYERGLHVRPLEEVSNPENRAVRECDHEFFSRNEPLTHRLVPFVTLDLHVLCNNDPRRAQRVIARVIGMLARFDINSQEFRDRLREHLRDRTDHFCHELYHFSRSPHTGLEAYFTHAVYHQDDDELQAVLQREDAPGPDIELISETVRNAPAFLRNRMRGHNRSNNGTQQLVSDPMVDHQYQPTINRPPANFEGVIGGAPSLTRSYQRLHDMINFHRRRLQAQLPIERHDTVYQQIRHDREREQTIQNDQQQHRQQSATTPAANRNINNDYDSGFSIITTTNNNNVQSQDVDVVGDDDDNDDDEDVVVDGPPVFNLNDHIHSNRNRIQAVRERWDDFEAMRRLLDPAFSVDARTGIEPAATEIDLTNEDANVGEISSSTNPRRQGAAGDEGEEDGEVIVFDGEAAVTIRRPQRRQHTGRTPTPPILPVDGAYHTSDDDNEELQNRRKNPATSSSTTSSAQQGRRRKAHQPSQQWKPVAKSVVVVVGGGDGDGENVEGPILSSSDDSDRDREREEQQNRRSYQQHPAAMLTTRNGAAAAAVAAIRNKLRRKRRRLDDENDGPNEPSSSRRKSTRLLQQQRRQKKKSSSSDYFFLRSPEYEDVDSALSSAAVDNGNISNNRRGELYPPPPSQPPNIDVNAAVTVTRSSIPANQDASLSAFGEAAVVGIPLPQTPNNNGTASFLNRLERIRRQRRLAEIWRQNHQSNATVAALAAQSSAGSERAAASTSANNNDDNNATVLLSSSPSLSSSEQQQTSSEQRQQSGNNSQQHRSKSSSSSKDRRSSSRTKETNNDNSSADDNESDDDGARFSSPDLDINRRESSRRLRRRREQRQRELERVRKAPIWSDIFDTGEVHNDPTPTIRDTMLNGYLGYWQTATTSNSNNHLPATEPSTSKDTTNWEDMSSAGSDLEVVCEMKPKHLRTPPLVDLLDNDETDKQQQSEKVRRVDDDNDKSTSASAAAPDNGPSGAAARIMSNNEQKQHQKTSGSCDSLVILDDDDEDDNNDKNDRKITDGLLLSSLDCKPFSSSSSKHHHKREKRRSRKSKKKANKSDGSETENVQHPSDDTFTDEGSRKKRKRKKRARSNGQRRRNDGNSDDEDDISDGSISPADSRRKKSKRKKKHSKKSSASDDNKERSRRHHHNNNKRRLDDEHRDNHRCSKRNIDGYNHSEDTDDRENEYDHRSSSTATDRGRRPLHHHDHRSSPSSHPTSRKRPKYSDHDNSRPKSQRHHRRSASTSPPLFNFSDRNKLRKGDRDGSHSSSIIPPPATDENLSEPSLTCGGESLSKGGNELTPHSDHSHNIPLTANDFELSSKNGTSGPQSTVAAVDNDGNDNALVTKTLATPSATAAAQSSIDSVTNNSSDCTAIPLLSSSTAGVRTDSGIMESESSASVAVLSSKPLINEKQSVLSTKLPPPTDHEDNCLTE